MQQATKRSQSARCGPARNRIQCSASRTVRFISLVSAEDRQEYYICLS